MASPTERERGRRSPLEVRAIAAASAYRGSGRRGSQRLSTAFADLATRFNDTAVALGGRVLAPQPALVDTV